MPRPTAKRCSTSPGPATRAQSTATDRRSWENAYPSERNLGLLTGQCRAGGVALFLTGLSDQFPQAGLKRRTPVGECQATAGQLLGLRHIPLGPATLGQANDNPGFTQ